MDDKTFTYETVEKMAAAASVEELRAIAEESGVSLTPEEAAACFAELRASRELTDELLDVSGGAIQAGNFTLAPRGEMDKRCDTLHPYRSPTISLEKASIPNVPKYL